jgi:hypothetical protein
MRAWKVFEVKGKPVQLKIQKDGFEIFTVTPASFGFLVIAFMDQSNIQPPSQLAEHPPDITRG